MNHRCLAPVVHFAPEGSGTCGALLAADDGKRFRQCVADEVGFRAHFVIRRQNIRDHDRICPGRMARADAVIRVFKDIAVFGRKSDRFRGLQKNIGCGLAVFKIANPNAVLRFCGGRMRLSDENQRLALKTCVEGIMIGNYLTTIGKEPSEDIAMVKELGKKIK